MKGFRVHKTDDGRVPPCEYYPAGGLTPALGMALTLAAGKLAKAAGAAAPVFVSMAERETACKEGETIPVLRAAPDIIFETEAGAALTGKKVGDKVSIHTDAMTLAAAEGTAEIVALEDDPAVGSGVLVRFVQTAPASGGAASGS